MNIYQARKMQKELFKNSGARFKRTRTVYQNGKLFYMVYHLLSSECYTNIDENRLNRINYDLSKNIMVQFGFTTKKINPNVPEGFYMSEFIEIEN